MTAAEVPWLSMADLRTRIDDKELTALEVTELALERAESIGAGLRAFIRLDAAGARRDAVRADRALAQGKRSGPLHGVPITIKDLIATRGLPTSAGSRAPNLGMSDTRDAPVVQRLRRAGAIILGKANLNEFAYGPTGENPHFGHVLNPWDRGRMSGGSSSGSGAALAAGIGYGSVGTDTRGSIRIPAACCGISGIKPTRGLLPVDGIFPLSWTLDNAGPMARSAADLATLLGVMAGSSALARRFQAALDRPLAGLKLGVCGYFFQDAHPEVAAAVRTAIDVLSANGMDVVEVDIPELDNNLRASTVIAASEGLSVHDKRLRDGAEGYGAPVLTRLEAAYAFTGVDLALAEATRRRIVDAYRRAFRAVDCMVGPTLPGVAAPIGSATMDVGGREIGIVDASVGLVAPANMAGVPAASVPCGFSSSGLPIGLQIWAGAGADDVVLAVAHGYQRVTAWHTRHPDLEDRSGPVPAALASADAAGPA